MVRESYKPVPPESRKPTSLPQFSGAGLGTLADRHEFERALVEIGLIAKQELETLAAKMAPAEGVLGLARVLQNAGKLTAYQAAALYQRKSRGLLIGNYLILDKLGGSSGSARFTTRHGLDGEHHALGDSHVFFLHDEDFLYSVRADAALDAGRALVDSIEPVPRPQRHAVETFRFWAD